MSAIEKIGGIGKTIDDKAQVSQEQPDEKKKFLSPFGNYNVPAVPLGTSIMAFNQTDSGKGGVTTATNLA